MAASLQAKRVALYARYSSDRQNPRSIEDQLRVCREHVERAAGVVDEALVFSDAAISGTSTARPGWQALERAVRSGLVDVVVTEDLSRVGRNAANTAVTLEDFRTLGARLIAVHDGLDTGERSSKLLGAIKGAMGEAYIDELRERTKRGQRGAFESGGHVGKRAFGYRIVAGAGGRKRLQLDETEAAVVRRIFELYLAGVPQRAICTRLEAEAVPGPSGRGWAHNQVHAMLRNPLYTGVVYFGQREFVTNRITGKRTKRDRPRSEWQRREQPELRIVDAATWQAVQERAAKVAVGWKAGERPRAQYPLSGLLVCDQCGAPLHVSGGPRAYYQCGGRRRGGSCSNRAGLRERDVRRWGFDRWLVVAGDDAVVADLRAWWASSHGGRDRAIKAELAERRGSIARIESKLSRLLDLVLEQGGETPSTRAKRAELEDHAELARATCMRLQAELDQAVPLPSADMIRQLLAALPDLAAESPAETRAFLGDLLVGPARCSPPAPGEPGWRVRFEVRLEQLLSASSAAVRPRSNVVVAGAGFALRRAPVVRIAWIAPGYAGGRP